MPCFPEIAACLRELPDIVLDGELVVLDEVGKPQFERVSRRARTRKLISVQAAAKRDPAALFAFDILDLRGKDLRNLPLLKRKQLLQDALRSAQRIRPVQYVGEQGQRLYDAPARCSSKASWRSAPTRRTRPAARRTGSRSVRRTGAMCRRSGQRTGAGKVACSCRSTRLRAK